MILGGNPAYNAPGDLQFSDKLQAFSMQRNSDGSLRNLTAHLGLYDDETSFKCQWHLPQTHFLEEWSDAAAFDGCISIVQPLIEPLYTGRSMIEMMQTLLETTLEGGYEIVRGFWREQFPESDFDAAWATWLERGAGRSAEEFHAATAQNSVAHAAAKASESGGRYVRIIVPP